MEELKEQIASCHSACQRMHTLCLPFSLLLVDRLKAKSHVRADENVAQPSHEWPSEELQPRASSSSTELPSQQPPVPCSDPSLERPLRQRQSGPRFHRRQAWGPWSIAPVFWHNPTEVQIGWMASCHEHCNISDDVRSKCVRQVHYGTGPNRLSDAECRRLAKCWLLLGRDIPVGDHSHTAHLKINLRRDAPAWTEEELDGMCTAL